MLALATTHWSFIHDALPLLKGDESAVCIPCNELFTIKYIKKSSSDVIEAREWHFTARSAADLIRGHGF